MPMVGRVEVGEWKTDKEGRRYLEIRALPTEHPVESSTKKSDIHVYDSIKLPDGKTLTVNLFQSRNRR